MKKIIYVFIFLFLFFSSIAPVYAQTYTSEDNYSGDWNTDGSWLPVGDPPRFGPGYNVNGDVVIYGEISSEASINIYSGSLTVVDTLYVHGDLFLDQNTNMSVKDSAVLIVFGSVTSKNKVFIEGDGKIVITGNLTINGAGQGGFSSDRDPALVFVGEIANVPAKSNYTIFDCNDYKGTSYIGTNCGYGDLDDLEASPYVDDLNQIVVCGGGVDPGSIGYSNEICADEDPDIITNVSDPSSGSNVELKWFFSIDSVDPSSGNWEEILGANGKQYDPDVLSKTTSYYRQLSRGGGVGCTTISNVVTITVNPIPAPVGVYHD